MSVRRLRNQESAYCPKCGLHTEQERGAKRGERYCWCCGSTFTLKESREAERDDIHLAAVDFKYDREAAERLSS